MANKFKKAVEAIPDIKDGFRFGVQALGGMSYFVTSSTPRLFDGSVDIDACTKDLYPNDARWDYVIGFNNHAYFLEIHPASTSNVRDMIKKAQWLDNWLNEKAAGLKALVATNVFYWIASGKYSILKNSPQSRMLAQSKIQIISNCRFPLI